MATDRRDNSPAPSEEEILRAMTAELRRKVAEARRAVEKGLQAAEAAVRKNARHHGHH